MRRFPYASTFVLGLGFFGISIVWPLFNSLIPPMLTDLGLTAVAVGFVMTWDNILNVVFQPWVGARSDATRTRFGRRRPWLMLGAPLAAVFFALVPFARQSLITLALAILGTNIAMALFRSPTIAYLGDLFEPRERSQANGVINLMGGIGGAVALFGGGALYRMGVPLPFVAGAAVMLIAVLMVILTVREPIASGAQKDSTSTAPSGGVLASLQRLRRPEGRSLLQMLIAIFAWFVAWNAVEAFFTVYARQILGIEVGSATQMLTAFAAALVIFAIPAGLLATRIGRKTTIRVGLAGMTVGLLAATFVRSPGVLLGLLAAMGACWALVNINSLPMVYDLEGQGGIGVATGLYYLASSAAAISGPILAGLAIDLGGHVSMWPFSLVFMLAAWLVMGSVPSSSGPRAEGTTA
ncbi:MAG TPA: SLC45 family MFS transporter [Anaerolineales bacterium]|nr:SLC45 family MFS transporter [Anaerolineales bacterium]